MLASLETRLTSQDVRVWFGNVTDNLEPDRLRLFYASRGFTVLDHGQPLPPFLGRTWVSPATVPPAFFFYEKLYAPRHLVGDPSLAVRSQFAIASSRHTGRKRNQRSDLEFQTPQTPSSSANPLVASFGTKRS
jgi:hypothetical protein